MAVEDSPEVITYPRELSSDPKKAFLEMHTFLTNELLEDLADNVSGNGSTLETNTKGRNGCDEKLSTLDHHLQYDRLRRVILIHGTRVHSD